MFPLSLFIGLRYTQAKRRNHFISFITLVSIIGIALGVMVLITVLSVMNGFDKELKDRILGVAPHVTVFGAAKGISDWQDLSAQLQQYSGVKVATPFVEGQGLLTHSGLTHFSLLQGIEPTEENKALDLESKMIAGSLQDLQAGRFGLVIGARLAAALSLRVGDKVTVVLPEASISLAGVMPRIKRFNVMGIFELGYDVDSHVALLNLADAQKLFRKGKRVSGINLRLANIYQAPMLAKEIASDYAAEVFVSDWTVRNGNFFKAVKMEKTLMFILLLFIVLVATFNILATLIMVVTEKNADIAILRTLGASPGFILRVFLVQGSVIGLVGTFIGIVTGLLLASNITDIVASIESFLHLQLMSSDVYYISFLPSEIQWPDVFHVTIMSLLMSFTFTLYPAWKAAKLSVSEVLRHE